MSPEEEVHQEAQKVLREGAWRYRFRRAREDLDLIEEAVRDIVEVYDGDALELGGILPGTDRFGEQVRDLRDDAARLFVFHEGAKRLRTKLTALGAQLEKSKNTG